MSIRTRYAPSPTGFMHIGNLRTALYEYLIAKREGGKFVLRIEDTDQGRLVDGATDAIYETLRLTGLQHDEGPDIGGDFGPYIQSERKAGYMDFAKQLVKSGHAYHCFCTKERLDTLADGNGVKRYDGHCLSITGRNLYNMLADQTPYVIRQLMPREGSTTFKDEVFGSVTIPNTELEDQVLIKSDGMPTYNFANVVDDHLMEITHVVRGSEYLTSTPKYKLLYEALGWDVPTFVHLPLLVNSEGKKISKRNGDASIPQLLDMGFLPEAIINYGALLGWSAPEGMGEIFTLAELEEIFDATRIGKAPGTFDMVKLTWVNNEHIKRMSADDYYNEALPYLMAAVPERQLHGADYRYLAEITQQRVDFIQECGALVDWIDTLDDYNIDLFTHKKMKTNPEVAKLVLTMAIAAWSQIDDADWNHETLYNTIMAAMDLYKWKNGTILWPLRIAASGRAFTPCGATEACALLGKDETLARFTLAVNKINSEVAVAQAAA